jgi:hypothetical protein
MRGTIVKIFLVLILTPALPISAQITKKQEADFKKTCYNIAEAFAKKNIAALNKYIDLQTGVYVITRPGAIDQSMNYKKLETKNEWMQHYPYKDSVKITKYKLTYGNAPRFNCGDNKWDKKGFVADSSSKNDRLSSLLSMRSQYENEQHTSEEMEKVKTLEKNSRRVVFTEIAKGRGLVFHLALINGKWHLFIIDTVAGNCEA